jgi:hypothetical protein
MVRALLAGTKTQTRRVVKLPHENPPGRWEVLPWGGPNGGRTRDGQTVPFQNVIGHTRTGEIIGCPHGEPGDTLWVRETWAPDPPIDDTWASTQWNGCGRTVSEIPERFHHQRFCNYAADWLHGPIRWTPSIHMPRWASRITLEVTGVRVERLQDISYEDALAEGACLDPASMPNFPACIGSSETPEQFARRTNYPQRGYRTLWEQLNGQGAWDANPWVWCIEFKRLPQPHHPQ